LKKVIVQLQGGLGNQLFQISFAYNLAHIIKANLAIDKSAFLLDRDFGRKFELNNLNLQKSSLLDLIFLYMNRLIYKVFKKKIIKIFNIVFLNDTENKRYEKKFYNYDYSNTKKIYIVGFFQSVKYSKSKVILKKFFRKLKVKHEIISMARNITRKDVFIGMRFYEENKYLQNSFGGIEDYKFYLDRLKNMKNIKNIYILSTKNLKNEIFYKKLKNKKIIINNKLTNDEKIYLMSKFQRMIISNSTFYLWGLFFSNKLFLNKNLKYYISKKFLNKNIV
jgi:hypothetical protein